MENQHRKITGYRDLSQTEIDLMNEIKALGIQLHDMVEKVRQHIYVQAALLDTLVNPEVAEAELYRLQEAEPHKWQMHGELRLQEGLMMLTRAVAQPTTF